MCKEFNIYDLPTWLVEAMHSEVAIYQLTELFILYNEEKTIEKYYEMLCKGLIEKNKISFEQALKQELSEITSNFKVKADPFEGKKD